MPVEREYHSELLYLSSLQFVAAVESIEGESHDKC